MWRPVASKNIPGTLGAAVSTCSSRSSQPLEGQVRSAFEGISDGVGRWFYYDNGGVTCPEGRSNGRNEPVDWIRGADAARGRYHGRGGIDYLAAAEAVMRSTPLAVYSGVTRVWEG